MRCTTQVIVLFSALASTSVAAHVYSSFYDENNIHLKDINFDVANSHCFSVTKPTTLSFSQKWKFLNPKGPYCLHGFNATGCEGPPKGDAWHEYSNVRALADRGTMFRSHRYGLDQGLMDAASFKWTLGSC
ncbi:hypothetical protein BDU57DRAFT_513288 [Ampelomyces quisqualis]|uniref:AA1-like domain-containing protein n=1 Tax=Ampelomyces quisqualis TaxID=50730 RepID=A0A6A5QXF4_AMPQU|nr:hypothetical protein BDU57DRAFT_513288 [Ampelomyces quisqualis]